MIEWLHGVDWLPWAIGLPLLYASLAFLFGTRIARMLALPAHGLVLLASVGIALQIWHTGPYMHAIGGWPAPLGIGLYADGLAALLLLMTALIALAVAMYARRYFAKEDTQDRYFWPLSGFLLGAMNALYLSADAFNLYVTLELLGLAAVGLVAVGGGAQALAAALRYLLAALLGSLLYLLGVALLYGAYGTLALAELAAQVTAGPLAWSVLALMLVGLAIKTALFPLHVWLPPAHGGAPAPVSALLSALVIKASFYLILRLWFDVFGAAVTIPAAQALGVLGAGAILWGSWLALKQAQLKMLVAYSTVAQVGYLFLLFPLAAYAEGSHAAWQGGVYQMVAHAFAKAAMFLAAGAMVLAAGHGEIARLGGMSERMPLSLFAFALSAVSLMGLPPSAGFAAKWLLLEAAINSDQWWWIVVMIFGGLLTAAYLFRVLRQAFLPVAAGQTLHAPPRGLAFTAFVLALIAVALGLWADGALALLGIGAPHDGAAS